MESPNTTCNTRILVIDDNIDAADMMAELLQNLGFTAIAVHDGRCGLDRAQAALPDVVFLDLGMPEMDGFQVARAQASSQRRADPHCGIDRLERRGDHRKAGTELL